MKGDKDAEAGYIFKYKKGQSDTAAVATMGSDTATGAQATVQFTTDTSTEEQNALAKALRDQGLTINATTGDCFKFCVNSKI